MALVAALLAVGGIFLLKVLGSGLLVYECTQLESEIKASIGNANYCNVDSDCVVLGTGTCPFGCFSLVNKNVETQTIQEKIGQYEKMSCSTCIYDCIVSPSQREIKCINNQCVDIRFQEEIDTSTPVLSPSTPLGINSVEGWQIYRNEEFGFEVKYLQSWTVQQANNAFHFLPLGEENLERGITLLLIDYNKTPPLPVWYTDTLLRTVEWQGKEVSIKKREPYPITVRYIGELTKDGYVAEFRMYLDEQYDNIFDQILSTFRFVE